MSKKLMAGHPDELILENFMGFVPEELQTTHERIEMMERNRNSIGEINEASNEKEK